VGLQVLVLVPVPEGTVQPRHQEVTARGAIATGPLQRVLLLLADMVVEDMEALEELLVSTIPQFLVVLGLLYCWTPQTCPWSKILWEHVVEICRGEDPFNLFVERSLQP
jgi:hypothetical protein